MPLKNGRLTPRERAFVPAMVATGDVQRAGEAAGLAQPRSQGYQMLARPAVAAEIVRLQTERLVNEILPLAIEQHKALLLAPGTPAGAKSQLIKLAYDRTMGSQEGGRKEIHEMTAAELAQELEDMRRRQAELAKPVFEGESIEVATEPTAGDVFS